MKRSKYGAKPTSITYKGKEVKCASKAEAKRFGELILLERAGEISQLAFHPRIPLYARAPGEGKKIADYVCDATYVEPGHERVFEEIKGHETDVWKLKKKIFHANYPYATLRVVKA